MENGNLYFFSKSGPRTLKWVIALNSASFSYDLCNKLVMWYWNIHELRIMESSAGMDEREGPASTFRYLKYTAVDS